MCVLRMLRMSMYVNVCIHTSMYIFFSTPFSLFSFSKTHRCPPRHRDALRAPLQRHRGLRPEAVLPNHRGGGRRRNRRFHRRNLRGCLGLRFRWEGKPGSQPKSTSGFQGIFRVPLKPGEASYI